MIHRIGLTFITLCSKIRVHDETERQIQRTSLYALLLKGPFICTSNLKIHLVISASSTETAAPALPKSQDVS